jgi:exosome complex component RRP4
MTLREIVLPGEVVEERKGRKLGTGVYPDGEKVIAKVLGIPRTNEYEISVIPLSGVYLPNIGDRVIGIISEVEISGWLVDINSPYPAFMPLGEAVEEFVDTTRTDISRFFDINDVIFCRISKVTKNKTIQASMRDMLARKLYGGVTIKINPTKIPRVIGKAGSMISLIKTKTKCDIYTGQNGVVWIRGENKAKAIEAILTIEKESHIIGLTEKIEKMLSEV